MFTIATDHSGRYIGVRDIRTGRFLPDSTLDIVRVPADDPCHNCGRNLHVECECTGYPDADATGRAAMTPPTDPAPVTKAVRLSATNESNLRIGRAVRDSEGGMAVGRMARKVETGSIGYVSAPTIRASRPWRHLRGPRVSRKVTVSYAAPSC